MSVTSSVEDLHCFTIASWRFPHACPIWAIILTSIKFTVFCKTSLRLSSALLDCPDLCNYLHEFCVVCKNQHDFSSCSPFSTSFVLDWWNGFCFDWPNSFVQRYMVCRQALWKFPACALIQQLHERSLTILWPVLWGWTMSKCPWRCGI